MSLAAAVQSFHQFFVSFYGLGIIPVLLCLNHMHAIPVDTAMGGFLGLNIVYTYAASGEVTGQHLDTAWPCTNLWSGFGILFSPVFSGIVLTGS